MRRYSYRDATSATTIFGGHFEFEMRGEFALVVLSDHLIPLAVNEIPTRIHKQFLWMLNPANVTFVEFDAPTQGYRLIDFRWTDTAGAYRFLSASPLSPLAVAALGLATARWSNALYAVADATHDRLADSVFRT